MQVMASKRGIGKCEPPGSIGSVKLGAIGQSTLGRERRRRLDRLFVNIYADNGAAGDGDDPERGTARPTANIEQSFPSRKFEPPQESVLLVCSEPAVLSDVFAKCFFTNLLVEVRFEVAVVVVVVSSGRRRTGFNHLNLYALRALIGVGSDNFATRARKSQCREGRRAWSQARLDFYRVTAAVRAVVVPLAGTFRVSSGLKELDRCGSPVAPTEPETE